MVKASNLIKQLLPIGLVIGGLYFLSQSKRVNIFRTTQPPDLTIQPTKNVPIIFDKLVPVPTLEPDETTLFRRYGQLYTKGPQERVDVTKQQPGHAEAYYGSGQSSYAQNVYQEWLRKNRTFEYRDVFTPLFDDDDE